MNDPGGNLQLWFWTIRFQTETVLSVLRYQLVLLIGEHRGDAVTAFALLAFVVGVFTMVFVIAWFIGTTAKSQPTRYCPHGWPLGQHTKNFCRQCAREKRAAEEIHARLRAQRARRLNGED